MLVDYFSKAALFCLLPITKKDTYSGVFKYLPGNVLAPGLFPTGKWGMKLFQEVFHVVLRK